MSSFTFTVSEIQHARSIGETFHRTRMLRRALLHKLTEKKYAEMPGASLMNLSAVELMQALQVVLDRQRFLLLASDTTGLNADARARQSAHMYPGGHGPGSRRCVRQARGLPVNTPIYGYARDADGWYRPLASHAEIIRSGFKIAADEGYAGAGRYMQLSGLPTPGGQNWDKDNARDFFRNPIYAGYSREYIQARKRGPVALTPARLVVPLIRLSDWIAANRAYIDRQKIEFPHGFLSSTDQQAWTHSVRPPGGRR